MGWIGDNLDADDDGDGGDDDHERNPGLQRWT
jgi:hypothetical protein